MRFVVVVVVIVVFVGRFWSVTVKADNDVHLSSIKFLLLPLSLARLMALEWNTCIQLALAVSHLNNVNLHIVIHSTMLNSLEYTYWCGINTATSPIKFEVRRAWVFVSVCGARCWSSTSAALWEVRRAFVQWSAIRACVHAMCPSLYV